MDKTIDYMITEYAQQYHRWMNDGVHYPSPDKTDILIQIEKRYVRDVISVLTDVAQLIDGWHTDVVWSEWDEAVRKKVSNMLQKLNTPLCDKCNNDQ